MEKKESCLNCRHYTDDIGDKGYCKLYRHNTSLPDFACPKFEKKEARERRNTLTVEMVKDIVLSEVSKNKNKFSMNRMLMMASVVCITVLSVLLLIFSTTLCATLATFNQVSVLHRTIFIILVAAFVISSIVIVCMILSRFKAMRIIILIISLAVVIILLAFSNEIWFDFHSLIINLSETIFNI